MMFVGRGRITQFHEDTFTAGKPHTIEIECDLWPEITYAGGYKNMEVTVNAAPIDMEKYEQVSTHPLTTPTTLTLPFLHTCQLLPLIWRNMNRLDR